MRERRARPRRTRSNQRDGRGMLRVPAAGWTRRGLGSATGCGSARRAARPPANLSCRATRTTPLAGGGHGTRKGKCAAWQTMREAQGPPTVARPSPAPSPSMHVGASATATATATATAMAMATTTGGGRRDDGCDMQRTGAGSARRGSHGRHATRHMSLPECPTRFGARLNVDPCNSDMLDWCRARPRRATDAADAADAAAAAAAGVAEPATRELATQTSLPTPVPTAALAPASPGLHDRASAWLVAHGWPAIPHDIGALATTPYPGWATAAFCTAMTPVAAMSKAAPRAYPPAAALLGFSAVYTYAAGSTPIDLENATAIYTGWGFIYLFLYGRRTLTPPPLAARRLPLPRMGPALLTASIACSSALYAYEYLF
ncbi:hypothetical protein CXG81DRAFT_21325 [Caulochytrium protostelioides]|uniref:Uncharacterized protein n=1 Tax=Caulochytrium protostelioides TaxID=1555241 RepID=A0A4P9X0F3_9FUNG|nr:hypothetical protein CXG81DRAFT_21325 [Caulochytrium protostelioides]|eukprot:RKO98442.1 hypothetical protein CXG81DRAFT_21325 [Caulochytrium protostelioides]